LHYIAIRPFFSSEKQFFSLLLQCGQFVDKRLLSLATSLGL
jgi:hypothetical protein